MTGCCERRGSAARFVDRASAPAARDLVVRDRRRVSFHVDVRRAILDRDYLDDLGRSHSAPASNDGLCLIVDHLSMDPPAYQAVLIDIEGRLLFAERLTFVRSTPTGSDASRHGLITIAPDPRTREALHALGDLITDRTLCVPDELSPELDGVRDVLREAFQIVSLAPMLAWAADGLGEADVGSLITWLADGFDSAPQTAGRARFVKDAWAWTVLGGAGRGQ